MKKNKLLIAWLLGSITPVFGQVGIGTAVPNSSSMVDVDVTAMAATAKKGLLPPRLDNTQRNAIVAPAEGLTIYNTTTQCLEFYNGTNWICHLDLPKNGSTANRAASTCKSIKDTYPASADGIYWLDADGSGPIAASQAYCDMTTDGGGWTLIGINGSGTSGTQAEQLSVTGLTTAGYLPKATVIPLAANSSQVQLRSGNSSTSYSNKLTSQPGGAAILALRSTATAIGGDATWHRAGAVTDFTGNTAIPPVGTWGWNIACSVISTGWPLMYHSCGTSSDVHWLLNDKNMNRTSGGDAWSSTWIR